MELPKETLEFFNGDELRARTFYEKYALRNEFGEIVERAPDLMWRRVANEMAGVEETVDNRFKWNNNFYNLLKDFKFIPGGRILFGAGQVRRSTLLNCYFIPIKEDSIEGIFNWCKEAARTYSFGGGVGTDISVLRPKGDPVNNSAIYSTGAVSFMQIMSETTSTIGQAGRRGALMITIRCDHPDIFDFIDVKNDAERTSVRAANISVKITDEFMEAVERDGNFNLKFDGIVYKTVKARDIWDKLVKSAWQSAEPGIIFWDNVKNYSPTEYNGMEVNGTNPCGEQPLEDYGACNLGNVNLSMYVDEEGNYLNYRELGEDLYTAVRFLDNVLDYNAEKHPLSDQRTASLLSRRIGVGFTGLGDMLIKLGYKYDTDEAIEFVDDLFNWMKHKIYYASVGLAKEKFPAPGFDKDKHFKSQFMDELAEDLLQEIEEHGIRNCCSITCAPVGSGSILAGTSSGVEPIFSRSYKRRSESLSQEEFTVYHPLVKKYMDENGVGEENLPSYFITSHDIDPLQRVKMQAAIQRHIDSSISSTINLPEDVSLETVGEIYMEAWRSGCKGVTVYREGSREGILITEDKAQEIDAKEPKEDTSVKKETVLGSELVKGTFEDLGIVGSQAPESLMMFKAPKDRPKSLEGFTESVKTDKGTLYVTVNSYNGVPVEVFVQIGKSGMGKTADAEAVGRLISLSLRSGISIKEIIKQLESLSGEDAVYSDGELIRSVPDAVAKVLRRNFLEEKKTKKSGKVVEMEVKETVIKALHGYDITNPDCENKFECDIINDGGCKTCRTCGWSKC